jgi:putative flippase GtrA
MNIRDTGIMEKRGFFETCLELMNFSFVGVTTFSIQLFITVIMTEMVKIAYYISYAVALACAWFLNFMLNTGLTFRAKGDPKQYLRKFASLVVINIVLNWLLVIFCVEVISLPYFPAIILVAIFMSLLNFFVEDFWVFKRKKPS